MSENKKPKIIFAPGALDNFDGSQEDLAAMIAEITELVESGDFFISSNFIDAATLDEEAYANLIDMVEELSKEDTPPVTTWKMH